MHESPKWLNKNEAAEEGKNRLPNTSLAPEDRRQGRLRHGERSDNGRGAGLRAGEGEMRYTRFVKRR